MHASQPRTPTRAIDFRENGALKTLAATRNELGAWRRGQRTGRTATRCRARRTHRRYTSRERSTRGCQATNVSLAHSDSTFLNEKAQRHLSDRPHWDATAKTAVRSLLTIVGAKDLSCVGATRLTLVVRSSSRSSVRFSSRDTSRQ